ncbi:MAG TPA: penicillin-binding protein 1C [Bacteroidales bacterium]|nr:penicillin-binding protein 1C [Bacteroidales bacterium]
MSRGLRIVFISVSAALLPVLIAPMPRFRNPLSTVVEAADGTLLGARVADDGQWRFPPPDSVPYKFTKALLAFEDNYFYYHPGVNPVSLLRALKLNIKAGRVISGGSTVTMQVARLAGGNPDRTYPRKLLEILSALKLELLKSKKEILKMYAANAPFGGSTVGIEAASWRYFGTSCYNLSWAGAATLAVLPNSPSLVHPGKNRLQLKKKRDDLLKKLFEKGIIDSLTFSLSVEEPLPEEPSPLPDRSPHLTARLFSENHGQRTKTSIDPVLQEKVQEIINSRQRILQNNRIFNSACIVVRVNTGEVLAYAGNCTLPETKEHSGDVDIIRSPRSSGSILKPLLYAGMQQSGLILPNTLIPDIPTFFTGFAPKNFDMSYSGAVPASEALAQSLNVPAVRMLRNFREENFLDLLRLAGFTTFTKPAGYYGLSMILGGGEITLWELAGVYASLSRVLMRYCSEGRYSYSDYHPPVLVKTETRTNIPDDGIIPLSASSIWLTYKALEKVNRPETETGWQYLGSSGDLAWKTGTSYGYRDAWAVGTTPSYVIAVWAGNATGEGRPGLTGTEAAAPILFEVCSFLKNSETFPAPYNEMTVAKVCRESGYRAGPDCRDTVDEWICTPGLKSEVCPYHKIVHLDKSKKYRTSTDCAGISEIVTEKWFVLPPSMEYYYRFRHPEYRTLPPFAPGCPANEEDPQMEMIYPVPGIKIFIPRDQEGKPTRVVAEIAHRQPSRTIYWHLDEKFTGQTKYLHKIELLAPAGDHILRAVDQDGLTISCRFTVLNSLK